MLRNVIIEEMIEALPDYEGVRVDELVYDMYGTDYYIIGTHKAKEFIRLNIDEAFKALEEYQSEFGESYSCITNYESVASLMVLRLAEKIWCELDSLKEQRDEKLNPDLIQTIISELKNKLED